MIFVVSFFANPSTFWRCLVKATEATDWAAVVFVRDGKGRVALVFDEYKPLPHYWKLPGGRKKQGETPPKTAARELEEETGLHVEEIQLTFLVEVPRKNHSLFVYGATIENFDSIARRGVEGERVAIFSLAGIEKMPDFFPSHRKILEDLRILQA